MCKLIFQGLRTVVRVINERVFVLRGDVCDASQYKRLCLKKPHKTLELKEQSISSYSFSLYSEGQLIKPSINDNNIIQYIPILVPGLNVGKNPLTQAATIDNLNISNNAFETIFRRFLWNIDISFFPIDITLNYHLISGKSRVFLQDTSYKLQENVLCRPAGNTGFADVTCGVWGCRRQRGSYAQVTI